MQTAWDWKRFYAAERRSVGSEAMLSSVADAEPLAAEAVVVPHTRLAHTASQYARAVSTVLASGSDRVLAIGVLHGARRTDAELVARARAGDPIAIERLRGVHTEDGLASEEFSLDTFTEMVTLAAGSRGRRIEVVRRYPFLVGDDPASLSGVDELIRLAADSFVVATTDPMHHGVGYGTETDECRAADDPTTMGYVRGAVTAQVNALRDQRYGDFARLAESDRSDFRDSGPLLSEVLGALWATPWEAAIEDLTLVPYADVLDVADPTWVAASLISIAPAR